MTSRLHPWRIAVVFAFGLLHGMGFAEALAGLHLSAVGSSDNARVIQSGRRSGTAGGDRGGCRCALALVSRMRASASIPAIRFASAAIGVIGTIWTIQRISGG